MYKNPFCTIFPTSYESVIISKCKVKKLHIVIDNYIKWSGLNASIMKQKLPD